MKSDSWYINKLGKAEGPKSTKEIQQLLASGSLLINEKVFCEGYSEWKVLSEIPEFTAIGAKTMDETTTLPNENKSWVLLVRSQEDTFVGKPRFVQVGPLSREEVLNKIDSGEAHWGDHVWKPGFSSWQKLSEIADFERSLSFDEEKTVSHDVELPNLETKEPSSEELLANVGFATPLVKDQFRIVTPPLEEPKPEEATGQNLVQNLLPKEVAESLNLSANDSTEEETVTNFEIKPEIAHESDASSSPAAFKKNKHALYGLGAAAIALVLTLSSYFFASDTPTNEDSRKIASVEEMPVKAAAKPALAPAAAPVAVAPVPAETKEVAPVPEVPKYLKIKALKLESSRPQLVFETNADPGQPIQVKITGKKGEILELVRFDKATQIARQKDEVPSLDLTKWDLPSGNYRVQVSVNDTKAEQSIFLGQKNRKFQTALDAHNKKLKQQAIKEKKEVAAVIAGLDKQAIQLSASSKLATTSKAKWQKFYSQWAKDVTAHKKNGLGKFKAASANKYVYPTAYEKTQQAANELFRAGREFDERSRSKRAPASTFQLKKYKTQLNDIKKELN